MGRRAGGLRHQSPTSNKDIVAKFFGGNTLQKNTFRWNRPINASMDHKAIQRIIEERKLNDKKVKEQQNLSSHSLGRIVNEKIEAGITDTRNALLSQVEKSNPKVQVKKQKKREQSPTIDQSSIH